MFFLKKRTKNFLIELRGKTLRKLCRVYTTHNDFFCILTGAEKIYNLLLKQQTHSNQNGYV